MIETRPPARPDVHAPIPVLQARIERLRAAVEEAGLAAAVIFSPPRGGSARYLLDWPGAALIVVPARGEPAVTVTGPYDAPWFAELCPWIADARLEGPRNHGRLARAILRERGLRGRIGLIGAADLGAAVAAELTAPEDGLSFEPVDPLLASQRMVKDEVALGRMRRAAEITEKMLDALVEELRPGTPAWRGQAAMNATALLEGADTTNNWLVAGRLLDRTRFRREENFAPFQVGDCVAVGLIITYLGYHGHTLRMFSLGEPAAEPRRVWAAVCELQDAAAALLRPDVDARRVPLAAEEVLFRHFPEAREGDVRRFQVSHFIGADYAEYPSAITATVPSLGRFFPSPEPRLVGFPLEVGMTMELHPNICPPGLGFGSVGDIFRVGETGGERLTGCARELRVVEPR